MATATCFPADTRPAFVEFSLLESWLASSSALQLPLHQIESQQQAKGREVQRLLLQAHFAASRRRRYRARVATRTGRRRGALLSPPSERPIPYHRLWNRGTRSYGLLPAQRAEHLSPRQSAGLARTLVLLRTPAPPGQGRRAEPVSGIGSNHCRVDRRRRLQTQSGGDPSGCGSGL